MELLAVIADVGDGGKYAWSLAGGWTSHPAADSGCIEVKLGERAAQGVAMHAEFFRGLALVALVMCEDLQDVAPLELPESVGIWNTGAVHLRDQAIQFALHDCPHPCFSLI